MTNPDIVPLFENVLLSLQESYDNGMLLNPKVFRNLIPYPLRGGEWEPITSHPPQIQTLIGIDIIGLL